MPPVERNAKPSPNPEWWRGEFFAIWGTALFAARRWTSTATPRTGAFWERRGARARPAAKGAKRTGLPRPPHPGPAAGVPGVGRGVGVHGPDVVDHRRVAAVVGHRQARDAGPVVERAVGPGERA